MTSGWLAGWLGGWVAGWAGASLEESADDGLQGALGSVSGLEHRRLGGWTTKTHTMELNIVKTKGHANGPLNF